MCACTVREAVKIPILSGEHIGPFVAFDGLGSTQQPPTKVGGLI